MKTTYVTGILAAALMLGMAQGCSDNYDSVVMPVKNGLELKVDGHSGAFSVDYGAAPDNDIRVAVESNTLWKVEIECEGGWCTSDKATGRGDETFTLSILENINKERSAFVTVYMVDSEGEKISGEGQTTSIQMTLKQAVSDVRLTPSSLAPFAPTGNERVRMGIESNVAWTLDVTYEGENTADFVNITPSTGMTANGDGTYSGDGEASFDLTLADNRTAAERRAFLNLRSVIATYSVEIRQNKSDYTFDVSPVETRVVAAEGGTLTFGVYSQDGWEAVGCDWIGFSPSGMTQGSDSRVETVAWVAPNSDGVERSAQVYFVPRNGADSSVAVTVIQRGYEAAFSVSRSDSEGIVMDGGGELMLELDSRFRWTAEAPSWLRLGDSAGGASTSVQRIGVAVEPNRTSDNRTGYVTLTPLPTEFPGGVTLDPSLFNLGEVRVGITQFGGREAAISVPWLRDGYTQTSATVEFNYYSPYYRIVEAGLEYLREDSSAVVTATVSPSDPTEGTASFTLQGLDPATKYTTRGFVVDEMGNVKYGDWSYPFTTAGQYPGSGDNPTPTK